MNLTLREVYQTSSSGDVFWKLPECYIKGATVSYNHSPQRKELIYVMFAKLTPLSCRCYRHARSNTSV